MLIVKDRFNFKIKSIAQVDQNSHLSNPNDAKFQNLYHQMHSVKQVFEQ